ncbi:hypothetical protein BZG02_07895 [Labilibaculum filiforme]|uniref:Thioredoxin domain-containing protein n=1 Tax=Labilibaculum filiforme TaxID=1940526 RepID=A0A2N3I0U5_9BACT|nr:DUF255 domain-containing protein [Labilibaculum filiforme]PKQ63924.1 hypothetical protein BZG02_07895 [Labilibaculum filiforme]
MKKVFGIIVALFISLASFAQGIAFEHGTFAEALAKAKKENKMVFMDCFTTWCGPCKMMSSNIFPQKEVGDFFNAKYVSIKIDMEKGEGIDLLKTYNVKAFPTMLFLNAEGTVLHTMVGGSDAEGLIAEGKIALDPSQRIGALKERYAKGERDVKFISKYIQALQKAYDEENMSKLGKEFLSNTPVDQLCNEDAFTIMACAGVEYNSKAYSYLIANKAKFIELAGEESYAQLIGTAIHDYLTALIPTLNLEGLKAEIEKTKKDFVSPQQEMMEEQLLSQYYISHKEYANWFDANEKAADKALVEDKNMGLSMYINTAYRVAMDPAFDNAGIYDKAIALTLKVKDADSEMLAAYYCLASLYKKTNNKEKALENINIFISKNAETGGSADARVDQLKSAIEAM